MIADEMKDLWTEKRYEEFLRLGVEQPEIAEVVLCLFTSAGLFDHHFLALLIVESLQFKISLLDQIKHLLPRLENLEVGVAVERAMLHLRVTVTVAIYDLHEESRILRKLYF